MQNEYQPVTWRIEYLPPNGSWTLLARETAPVSGLPTLSRTYHAPQGALGDWQMRAVVEHIPDTVATDDAGTVTTFPSPQGSIKSMTGVALQSTTQSTITGKATSRYKRSYHVPLPAPGPWDIKVVRDTADSTVSALQNETWFDSIAEIVESKLCYPNTALVGISVDAEQFADIPSRGYDIYGIKCQIPSNYNPVTRTYTGMWDGTFVVEWTNNPAWVYYDLLTNARYALGQYIDTSGIDKWALYEIAQYCDGMVPSGFGYLEPRFTCNLYIQTREDAYKVLMNLTSIFRGMAFWSAGQVTTVCDMPTDAVSIFTNANVIDGAFSYAGSSRAARHTVALVTWNDPENAFKQAVEYVEDIDGILRYGVNQTEVVAYGCTSRGQAHRMGKWILYTERLESEVISWKTGLEGTSVYPGAIVKVADNLRSGDRIGGRALDATINSIALDAPVTLAANMVYTLSVVLPEGGVSNHTVTTAAGTTSVLHVTPDFSAIPQVHSMWVLASVNLNPQTFRILSVKESGKTQVEITALQHDPQKFAMIEYDAKFNPTIISSIKSTPDTPTNLKASDTLFDQGPGLVGVKLHFSWEGKAARFDVRWKQGDDNAKTFSVTTNYADISPVSPGVTTLQVRGVSVLGSPSKWSTLNYDTLGKLALPGDVTGFTAAADQTGVNLKWDSSPEIDVNRYELRSGVSGCTWDTATDFIGEIYATALRVALVGATTTYLIKAIDTSENESDNAAASTVVVGMPATPTLSAKGYLFSIKFDWMFGDSRQDVKGTELWWSPSSDNRAAATRLTFEPFPSSTYTQIGLEPGKGGWYWIRAVDNFGNVSGWSPASAVAGLHAISETDPTSLLSQLQSALGMPQLAAELASPIALIPTIATDIIQTALDLDAVSDRVLFERAVTDSTITLDPVTGKFKLLASAEITTDVEARLTQIKSEGDATAGTLASTVATLSEVSGNLSSTQSQVTQLAHTVSLGVSDVQIADIVGKASGAITVESAAAAQQLAEVALRQSLGLDAATDADLLSRSNVALAQLDIKANSDALSAEASSRLVLAAVVEQQKAVLTDEQTVRADALTAEAKSRLALAAVVAEGDKANAAAIQEVKTASATAAEAVALRTSNLEAAVNSATTGLASKASIAYADQAKADAISAAASRTDTVQSQINIAVTNAQGKADAAQGAANNAQGTANAAVSNAATAQGTANTAVTAASAAAITANDVQARLSTGDFAAVKQESSTTANKMGKVEAKWVMKTQTMADGVNAVAGIELVSGEGGSAFAVLADKFLFYQPNGQGAPKQLLTMGTVNGVPALGFDGSAVFDGSVAAKSLVAKSVTADQMATRTITAESAILDHAAVGTLEIAGNAVTVVVPLSQTSGWIASSGNETAQWASQGIWFDLRTAGAQKVTFLVTCACANFGDMACVGIRIIRRVTEGAPWEVVAVGHFNTSATSITSVSMGGIDEAPWKGQYPYVVELFNWGVSGGPWRAEPITVTAMATLK